MLGKLRIKFFFKVEVFFFAFFSLSMHVSIADGYIAQWLERLTADQQVPGSNPGVPSCTFFGWEHQH